MSTGPKTVEKRGGYRPNSGRKPEALSESQVRALLGKAKDYEKKFGKTVDEVLLDIIYALSGNTRDKLAAIKIFKECSRLQEGGEGDKKLGPAVYLPAQRPDPAVVVSINKEQEAG